LHDTSNLGHILGNMFALWMFGTPLENRWGGKRFFIYYFVTGFGAAALHLGVNYWDYLQAANLHALEGSLDALYRMQSLAMTPTVGASGRCLWPASGLWHDVPQPADLPLLFAAHQG